MINTTIKVPFVYTANVIMPRCRKAIEVLVQDTVNVEIKGYSKSEAPIAFKADNDSILYCDESLWSKAYMNVSCKESKETLIDTVKENTENFGENYRWSRGGVDAPFLDFWWDGKMQEQTTNGDVITKEELVKVCREWVSDNRDEVITEILSIANNIISVDGKMYEPKGEPRYCVLTFGLGRNHGGTGLFVDYSYNPNISSREYFTALEYDKAVKYAVEVANNRGDNESIKGIKREATKIEVLLPDVVSLNPRKEHFL